jgi:hypothetical protein
MAKRGTSTLGDLFDGSPLTATSSIFPATPATSPVLPAASRTEEVEGLLPWGCERSDQAQQDLG